MLCGDEMITTMNAVRHGDERLQFQRSRGRKIKTSSLISQQVSGQSGSHENVFQNIPKSNKQSQPPLLNRLRNAYSVFGLVQGLGGLYNGFCPSGTLRALCSKKEWQDTTCHNPGRSHCGLQEVHEWFKEGQRAWPAQWKGHNYPLPAN